jgi:hypothetical protein
MATKRKEGVPLFGEIAGRLVANGYSPLPITPGTKKPAAGEGWTSFIVASGSLSQYDGCYTGLLAKHTPLVDIDVRDPELAGRLHELATRMLGRGLVRIGAAPKVGLVYQAARPFSKKVTTTYLIGGQRTKVEVLGDGQQYLVYAIHPETKLPYTWPHGDVLSLEREHLVMVTEAKIDAFIEAADAILAAAAPPVKATKIGLVAARPAWKHEVGKIRQVLRRLSPSCERDTWVQIGMAIHYAAMGGPAGFDVWQKWSEEGENYGGLDDCHKIWASFGKRNKGEQITLGTLYAMDPGDGPTDWAIESARDYIERYPLQTFLVDGILPERGIAAIWGPSGSGKTFVVLDLVACVAGKRDWLGGRTKHGDVGYIVAEGHAGFGERLRAARTGGLDLDRLHILSEPVNFLEETFDPVEVARRFPDSVRLLVVDTLAATMHGDENTSRDMGMYVGRLRALADEMKCLAVVVHHIGKDVTKGERGHSSFRAALDASIAVEHDEKDTYRWLIPSKARDSAVRARMGFTLDVVGLGRNADGDERTSCIVEWHLDAEPAVVGKGKGAGLTVRVVGLTAAMLKVLTVISSNDRPTIDQIADKLGITRSTLKPRLEELQHKKHLITSRPVRGLRRYDLTEKGEKALESEA